MQISALKQLAAFLIFALVGAQTAMAEGSADAGQKKAATCAACHGQDGNSLNPEWPSLAGQHEQYIVRALKAYRPGGSRNNVLMMGQVAALSEQDMADLGAYFAGQKRAPLTADPALVAAGERLYRGGNKARGISACIACHGPRGLGNPAAAYPAVAGQHATYTASSLRAYASQERESDPNQMMRTISSLLSEEDIVAVSSYIQGLE
ncbi:MAG: cytochrome c4 [Chromatiales bacterium]|nr:MAG: cytochrome c4 [Chromatiales bacterium]